MDVVRKADGTIESIQLTSEDIEKNPDILRHLLGDVEITDVRNFKMHGRDSVEPTFSDGSLTIEDFKPE